MYYRTFQIRQISVVLIAKLPMMILDHESRSAT